jgi:hypothetical protein
MKTKYTGTLHNFRLGRDDTIKLTFKVPLSELPGISKMLLLVSKPFKLYINSEGNKYSFDDVMLDKLSFDKDGEGTITFTVPVEGMEADIGFLNSCTQKPVMIAIKSDESGDE